MGRSVFSCIDGDTCEKHIRVVAKGGPELYGNSMSEKRQHFQQEYDWILKGLMFQPRGHDVMSGSILYYPPNNSENDAGALFIDTSAYLHMCVMEPSKQ